VVQEAPPVDERALAVTCYYYSAQLDVSVERAWRVVEAYSRAAVHIFESCKNERMEGDFRVVTRVDDDVDVYELVISTDAEHMRHAYTVPGLLGAEHHFATMQVLPGDDGKARFVWTTDVYPHDALEKGNPFSWDDLFDEIVTALNTQED
jgi:hypothetical protein